MQVLAFQLVGPVDVGSVHAAVVERDIAEVGVVDKGWFHGRPRSLDLPIVHSAAAQKDLGSWYRHQPRLERPRRLVHLWIQEGMCWPRRKHCLGEKVTAVAKVMGRNECQ